MLKVFPTVDHPSYTTRQSVSLGLLSGAAAVGKWVTYAATTLYSATVFVDTIGTSTYTSTTSAQQVSFFAVTDTNTTTAVSLSTTTWGPYTVGVASPVAAGMVSVIAFNTNTGAASIGGVVIPAYSEVYAQTGTDATAKLVVTLDYKIGGAVVA